MRFDTRTVTVPGLGLEFELLTDDTIIGPAIERGSWADHETLLFRAHLVPGCRVVDLGANVGWFAVQAIRAGAEVHAFEPVPAIAQICERNMRRAMARWSGRGVLHPYAAGERRTTARIALARGNHGDNRVLGPSSAPPADMGGVETLEIEIVPVDERVEGPVRFLKIDTQGSEWLALQGARRLLQDSPQIALLMEFWPYALRGARPEQLLGFLFEQGFRVGKATQAPYPMTRERILRQALARDPVRGGIDLYGTRGLPFHVTSLGNRVRAVVRSWREG
jgi:FkbM family methyltransferase